LDVEFAALNPADRYLSEGQYPARPPLPHVLGRDAVGVVSAVGAGVADVRVGDVKVLLRGEAGVSKWGTFAQKVAAPADHLVDVPPGWSHEQAAGAALVYVTAQQALTQWGPLPERCVTLITGASGGVGVAAVQLAKAMGHTIVALSRDADKREQLKHLGADVALDPADTQWRRHLKAALGDRRVDLAIDNVGGPLFNDVVDTLGMHGRVSVVGRLAGPVPHFNTASLFFRRARIGGVAIGTYTTAESRAAWADVLRLLAPTSGKPLVDSVFPFADLPAAFDKLAKGPMGKVLLRVAGE
jgi:NADPH2:quinone reductase